MAFLSSVKSGIFVTEFDFRASIDFNRDGLYPRISSCMWPCGVIKVLCICFMSMTSLPTKLVPVPFGVRQEYLPLTSAGDKEIPHQDNLATYSLVICKDSIFIMFTKALKCFACHDYGEWHSIKVAYFNVIFPCRHR